MGWWKIDSVETGQISCKPPDGLPAADGLLNAIPGRDSPNDLYNGDGPADAMDRAIKAIEALYQEEWGRSVTPDEVKACFSFCFNGWRREQHAPPGSPALTVHTE